MPDKNQPKYMALREYLREQMLMGKIKPGEQITSENVLAEKFSLSRHTVRKALSILLNEGYIYTKHGRGSYCSNRISKRKPSKNIGVITTYISEYIFPQVINGMDKVLSDNGYSIILNNTGNHPEKEAKCLENMLEKDIAGLIIEPTKSALPFRNKKYYDALEKHGIPYIFIHGYYEQLKDRPCVMLDDYKGMYSLVDYLIKNNHKNIAGIFTADDMQGINRHRGYMGALADNGIKYKTENVIWFNTEDKTFKPTADIVKIVGDKNRVDGIVCYNDEIAVGIVDKLLAMGINIPEDISVTGFDDSYLSLSGAVNLTTMSHPKDVLGETAAEIILGLISNNYIDEQIHKVIKPEIVVRDSTLKK